MKKIIITDINELTHKIIGDIKVVHLNKISMLA